MFTDLPKIIEIEPALTCNLRCRMCHVSYEPVEPRPAFPAELVDKLAGLANVDVLIGSNYEPTMNKGFAQIVRSLTRHGLRLELVTNATLLAGDNLAALADANVRVLVVSFDGARKATYEYIRRGANYEQTIENVRAARGQLLPQTLFALNCTVTPANLDEIGESVALWDRENFDQIRFIGMVVRHPAMAADSLYPLRDRFHANLDAAAEELIIRRRRISMAGAYLSSSPLKQKYPDHLHGAVVISGHPGTRLIPELRAEYQLGAGPGMSWPCRSPWTFARILPTGDVELCYKWRIGSLRDRAFKDIWFGPEAMAVRRKVIDDTAICPACDHYRFCLNGSSVDTMTAAAYVTTQRAQSEQIILLDQVGDYNLVTWRHQFFALNRSLGNVDVERYDVRRLPGTFIASSRRAIVAAAEQRQRRGPLQRKAEKAAARVAGVALRKSAWLRDRLQRQ